MRFLRLDNALESRGSAASHRLLGHLGRPSRCNGLGGFLLVSPLTPMARTRGASHLSSLPILFRNVGRESSAAYPYNERRPIVQVRRFDLHIRYTDYLQKE